MYAQASTTAAAASAATLPLTGIGSLGLLVAALTVVFAGIALLKMVPRKAQN